MIFLLKSVACILASIVIIAVCVALNVPVISRFPLEFGAILYFSLHLIWRPLYVSTGMFSDPPFYGEAIQKSPAAAVGMAAGMFGFVLVATVSILIQSAR